VRTTADIRRAKEEGKTGIILGFQNTAAVEDQVGYIQLFKELGVGIVQITYNTQNLVGAGCYEPRDSGLSGFGHEVVAEMNRVGILCDLSHVGAVTSRDVILASKRPTAYTHVLPAALKPHPRNKSDEEIRFIVEHGGLVGVTMFPPFLAKGMPRRSRITSWRSITSFASPARTMSASGPTSPKTRTTPSSSIFAMTRGMDGASPVRWAMS